MREIRARGWDVGGSDLRSGFRREDGIRNGSKEYGRELVI